MATRPKPPAKPTPPPPQAEQARQLWEAFMARLSGVVALCNQHWFRAAAGWAYDGRTLTLLVPTQAHADWLSSDMYRARLDRAALDLNRRGLKVAFLLYEREPATVHDGAL